MAQVGKLTLEATIKGFEDVQGLGKALKQVAVTASTTDTAFEEITARIKEFGKETFKTNDGLKGQIAAFDKLKNKTAFQGEAYKALTGEIRELNKELQSRISLEKEIAKGKGTGRGRPPAQRGDSLLLGKGIRNLWGEEDFRKQQIALQALLARGPGQATDDQLKFLTEQIKLTKSGKFPGTYNEQVFSGTPDFRKKIRESNAAFMAAELKQKGSGKHIIPIEQLTRVGAKLNEVQKEALGIRDTGNIRSSAYADVLQEIVAQEQSWTQIKKAQNTVVDEANAKLKAQQFIREQDIKIQKDRAKSFLFQKESQEWKQARARDFISAGEGKTSKAYSRFAVRPNIEELRNWQQQPFIQRFFESFAATQLGPDFQSPSWKRMFSEQSEKANPLGIFDRKIYQGGRQRIRDYIPRIAGGIGSFDPSKTRLDQIMRSKDLGFGKGILQPLDPFKLGPRQPAPKTSIGLSDELGELESLLPNLISGSEEWVKITEMVEEKYKEINEAIERGNKALKARKEEIALAVNPKVNQKLLPAAGQTVGSKRKRDAFLAGKDTGFGADEYGPQLTWTQRASESQKDFVKRLEESVKAGKLNINTLGKQRAKLDEIRNSLDPTSSAFKRTTQAIAQTDKALAKLNTNRFSGKNLGRTAQSILGASFFGGPAGFLGSTIGAGVEALRPEGDIAGGAITGGLVASQVLQPIASFGQNSAEYTAMIEKSNIALQAATRIEGDAIASKKAYAVALGTAASVTERFNVPQELAARGMTRLSAAVIGAGGNIHNAGIAFENISAAIKATGGSTEDTKAAVTAMVQIFSKGKVSAEELSGQLGERFPAAVTLFAEANNMTTQELQKGLKDGAIGLDKLWKFVLKLGDKYVDVAEKIGSASVEAGVRSQIAWNKVKLAVGEALQPIGADLQVIGAEILTNLVPALELAAKVLGAMGRAITFTAKVIVENFDKIVVVLGTFGSTLIWVNRVALTNLIKTLTVKLGNALSGVIAKMGLAKIATLGFAGSIKAARAAVVAFTASLMANPIIAVATGLSIAATAAWHFGRQWQRTVKEIESGKMTISDAKIKVAELKKALEGETNEEVKARLDTQIAMYEAAIKARQEIIKKANLGEADSFEGKDGKDGTGKWQIIRDHVDELGKQGEHLQGVFVNAFQGMEDAMTQFILTGKMNFKEFARSILADLARMIAKQMLFNMLSGIINRITAAPIGMTQGSPLPSNPNFVGVGANIPGGNPAITPSGIPGSQGNLIKSLQYANGGVFARNGIVPYSRGGIVNSPTLFPFAKGVGLMGEAGPEAIIPLKRGRGGKLGVAMQGGGGGTTNVNYTGPTLNFNGDEYVPKSAVGGIINAAAKQGASMGQTSTMRSLQNNRSTRSRLGM